ncbi:MAG: metal-dependent transcriptional regulator [Bdellovibrionota bacterium]
MTDSRVAPTGHNINIHTENYLKTIWNLSRLNSDAGSLVQNSQIADLLGVKRPTVTEMLQRLEEMGMTILVPRKGVRLSTKGERFVAGLLRRHRLIELFLQKTLKLSSLEAHEEAEVLEHAVTPALCARIEKFLGNPEYDLHGMPIPNALTKGVKNLRQPFVKASSLKPGQWGSVSACPDYNEKVYQRILEKGIKVGLQFKRVAETRTNSLLKFKSSKGKLYTLSAQEAELVQVTITASRA